MPRAGRVVGIRPVLADPAELPTGRAGPDPIALCVPCRLVQVTTRLSNRRATPTATDAYQRRATRCLVTSMNRELPDGCRASRCRLARRRGARQAKVSIVDKRDGSEIERS